VPERCSPEHKRRHDDDEERWRLELGAGVEEGERDLESEGERCVVLTFYRGRGEPGWRQQAVTDSG
jgi:hypothetical protein